MFTNVLTAADKDCGYQEDSKAGSVVQLGDKIVNYRLLGLVMNVFDDTLESTQHRYRFLL
jgi:hypothetical protein